jgi:hypothetical protein
MKVSFVDEKGEMIPGVIVIRNGVGVAEDSKGLGYVKLDPGVYTFKMFGYKDLQREISESVTLTMEELTVGLSDVNVMGYRTQSVWWLALLVLVVGYSMSKIRE